MAQKNNKGISLHIGLNAVDPGHYAGWSGELTACEADAEDMADIAAEKNFGTSDLLLTRNATRSAVIEKIGEAAQTLESGDLFFLSYSGHGGQLPDKNGDEVDGEDETWCLYDGELVDDEIYSLLGGFAPGVRIAVLSDSCHSGTVLRDYRALEDTRGGRAALTRSAVTEEGPLRYRAMPRQVALRTYRQNRDFYDAILEKIGKERASGASVSASARLISGCLDNQTSLDGTFNGLFTGTLLHVWNGGKWRGNYEKFYKAILKLMPPTQTPNQFFVGPRSEGFDAEEPFTI